MYNETMDFYEETLNKIEKLVKENNTDEALSLINIELSMPYIPSDFEEKILDIKKDIDHKLEKKSQLSIDEIERYLKMDESHQLFAVDYLNTVNLRDYYDIVNDYLKNGTYLNGKVLLIESLISQEISLEYTMKNDGLEYTFIPRFLELPHESDGFIKANELLEAYYEKEPSFLIMAKQLLYKECIMMLPISPSEEEGYNIAEKIEKYIYDCFNIMEGEA